MSRNRLARASLSILFILVVTLVAGTPALAVAATEPSEPNRPTEIFLENVDVYVVNVEAVVTDRSDRRVEGLGPEDFRLLVDGEEVPIAYFTEIRDRNAVSPASASASRGPAAALPAALEVDRPVPVRYLVFFDEVFTNGRDRRLMAREIEHHVDALGPDDTMTLVAFDGTRPEVLVDDSNDPRMLRAGLLRIGADRFFRGVNRRAEMDFFRTSGFDTEYSSALGSGYGRAGFGPGAASAKGQRLVDREVDRAFEALAVSMRRVARDAEPGRRVLLWVTGGWAIQPLIGSEQIRGPDRPGEQPEEEFDRKRRLERFSHLASRLGFTVYPIDAPGWEIQGLDMTGENLGATGTSSFGEYEVHATFETVAEITGGKAFLNSFRREALGRVIEDVGSYYWLGFDAPWASEGEEHEIELEVRRPGLQVRARTGVWAAPSDRLRNLDVLAARVESPEERLYDLRIWIDEVTETESDDLRVPIVLGVPVENFGTLPTESGYELHFEIRFVAIDRRGRRSDPMVLPGAFTSPRTPRKGDLARYDFEAILPEDSERVLVSIHDLLGDSMLVVASDL